MIIQTIIQFHKIRCNWNLRCTFPQNSDLGFHIIGHVPGRKTLPFQIQSHIAELTVLIRRLDLRKIIVIVAPECCPPCLVQFFNIIVEFACKVLLETSHTKRTVTFSTKLIRNMPHHKSRMIPKLIHKLIDDRCNFFSING